jgi:NADH:ubiquinone oxidoreductase subunit 3 (subunit A)
MGIILISIVILGLLSILYAASFWISSKKGDLEKLSTYETGFNPVNDARKKIDIIFWIIGLLYLIFDLEIIFIFPFASIIYKLNSFVAFSAFIIFLIILALGFLYEYNEGALEIISNNGVSQPIKVHAVNK